MPREPRAPGPCKPRGRPSPYTDADVVSAIISRWNGEPVASIAARMGTTDSVIRQWCAGTLRPACLVDAERRSLTGAENRSLTGAEKTPLGAQGARGATPGRGVRCSAI